MNEADLKALETHLIALRDIVREAQQSQQEGAAPALTKDRSFSR